MKVLLIQSWLGGDGPAVLPLGLACLSGALDAHELQLLDLNVVEEPFERLRGVLSSFRPDVVGISMRNIDSTNKRKVVFYYPHLRRTLDLIRAHSPARIVIGGSGFSMFAREIMTDEPRIDFGVFLEGEITFPALLDNLDDPQKVPSVFYRKNGVIEFSGHGPQVDMNQSGFPSYRHLDVGAYKNIPHAVGVETKRGCSLDCIYCIYGFLNGKRMRLREPERIVDGIEDLVRNHGVEQFTFVDSIFNLPLAHAERICNEIIKRDIKVRWSAWYSEKWLPGSFVSTAVRAGCTSFILSPDGFSDVTLGRLGKNITKSDILKSYETLKTVPCEISYNFFKNPPGQSLGEFISLMRFVIGSRRELGSRIHFEFNSMRVEPHTKLYDIALKERQISESDNLLEPKYYTNSGTRYIELLFNAMLRLKGK